jgi:mannose-6-phosphate isomerase-like protein (cupin superfamily)
MAHVPTESKLWGTTRLIYRDQVSEVCHASIMLGGYSSRHQHLRKDNTFYVLRGVLLINVFKDRDGELVHTEQLLAGESYTVNAGVWHSFEAQTAVELIETYSVGLQGSDIERANTGGIK